MASGKRFLLYSQHVAGAGHFVRTYEIARSLAARHDVFLIDGGRPVPRGTSSGITLVPIPRLCRKELEIVPYDSDRPLEAVMQERQGRLLQAIDRVQPDVLVIEHFPFSKWQLYQEVVSAIQRVRACNVRAKVVCSVRDMVLRCRADLPRESYCEDVLDTLNEHFDLLLAHADPQLARLDEEMPWLDQLQIPLQYTGYVSESLPVSPRDRHANQGPDDGSTASVVVSTGSTGGTALLRCAIDAWKILQSQPTAGRRQLTLFASLSITPGELQDLERHAADDSIRIWPFSTRFLESLAAADLSISNAGYNTCMNLLQARLRSILIPNVALADQTRRAERFAERGLARAISETELTPQRLANTILAALNDAAPVHQLDLNGARATREALESLFGGGLVTPRARDAGSSAPPPHRAASLPRRGRALESSARRYFLYSQHMAGTGHFVRTSEIAKALSQDGDVHLVDGGRPVPRELAADRIALVPLPRIRRDGHRVVPVDAEHQTGDIMAARGKILLRAIERIRPHLLMIEHFPFRRWEVCAEVLQMIRRARALDPGVKVVCSLRDIPGRSSFDPCIDRYSGDVLDMLHTHFDQLLIHADPRIVRLDEQIDWANRIEIPLTYTGYVSQKHQGDTRTGVGDKANVIVSAGGTGSTALLSCAIDAWKLLAARSAIGERTMALFLPLSSGDGELARLQQQASGQRIRVLPYTTKFLAWLARAELSISNAGYNTCTNILETRVRSILVANRQMSDQALRCERFAQMGLARTLEQAELTAERLADAILEQLDAPAPEHDYHLDGAEFTRGCLEHLLGRAQIHQFRMPNPLADSLGRPPGLRAG